ncbi:sugar ABC transporter ATP-binding protein [Hydrogenophaga sp.]|uniref:sugar ABC transporter ATP-binding protein n=1 Tax=Hydrogenophaga sp. TaxID=1904254 RepID=UPI00286DCCAF|nr:sugar ABC transporter ATP-binding protein [Hydrogenophaga sp.]
MSSPATSPVLQLSGVDMRFGRTPVLQDAQLRLFPGEVHALMGQNGAGKSTLIKVLTGVVTPVAGQMRLGEEAGWPSSPLQAQRRGISTVYQEVNLCPNLTVAENIFAGRYPRHPWWQGSRIDWSATREGAVRLLVRVGLDIDVTRRLSDYPVAIQQLVAIARALGIDARVLILDEPTSSLDDDEVKGLFQVLRRLREEGLAILFVTHFLDQVYAIADRITVLRNGRWVGEWTTRELPAQGLIEAMVGREMGPAEAPAAAGATDTRDTPALLQTEGLARVGSIQPTDLVIRPGEVLGIAGLLGAGRTELARLLFGLDSPDAGVLRIDGEATRFANPVDAIARGLAMCPEERKTEGIFADLSVRENIAIALQAMRGLRHPLPLAEQREMAERYIALLGIRTPGPETPVGLLSGGNQQKVVIARWLATAPRLLILDEPTRGIDVAAKQEIMDQILRLAAQGMAVVFISSEMSEVVRVSQRILVLRDRRPIGELPAGSSEDAVYELIADEHA